MRLPKPSFVSTLAAAQPKAVDVRFVTIGSLSLSSFK